MGTLRDGRILRLLHPTPLHEACQGTVEGADLRGDSPLGLLLHSLLDGVAVELLRGQEEEDVEFQRAQRRWEMGRHFFVDHVRALPWLHA